MPTKPMVKTLWLIIAAAFLIGLGLAGLGFALGGNAPVGFGSGGMRFVDFRTGTVYNSRMEPRESGGDPTQGTVDENIDRIRIQSIADIRIYFVDGGDFTYEIIMDGPSRYAVSTWNGEFEISPYSQEPLFGLTPNFGFGWGNWSEQRGEIIITVPQDLSFDSVSLSSIGSIDVSGLLCANNVQLSTVSGSINVESIGGDITWTNRLEVSSVSGHVTIDEARVNRLLISQVSGSADITLAELEDFNFNVSSVSASVTVDGQGVGSGFSTFGTGEHQAEISTVSGNINLTSTLEYQDMLLLGQVIEIAEQDLAERGISATLRTDWGRDYEGGRWVWKLVFETEDELPMVEYHIDANTGDIVNYEWVDYTP